jgi:DNA-binding LytR/AlgR family response regulator
MDMRCIIVDDEPLAREGLENYVKNIGFIQLVAVCENAIQANELVNNGGDIDLIFLDIHMPRLSGLDFLKSLKNPPMVIITTAYPNFALEGYALDVLDYLVKPISFERFLKAVNKANDFMALRYSDTGNLASGEKYIFIKADNRFEKIYFEDILFVEGRENYIHIQAIARHYMTLLPMKNIEQVLPKDKFLRVHKSWIVSIGKVEAIDGNELKINTFKVPISRNLKEEVLMKILNNRLIR